ncbi:MULTISPECIES: hypothetical protein [Nocardia]|uniref:hypothetical protein n=1 Tax=Nocardia TaxID=1817 RepID=UPI00245822B2|nr:MULTISPECIES: hypothetical protein [Nocardia]
MSPLLPSPMATQSAHPWRATVRTLFAGLIGLAAMLPLIVDATGLPDTTPGLAGALAISAAVTRLLALPGVNDWLRTYAPWLAADPA